MSEWTPDKIRMAFLSTQQSLRVLQEIPANVLAATNFYDHEDIDHLAPFGANVALDLLAKDVTGLMVGLVNHLSAKSVRHLECMGDI